MKIDLRNYATELNHWIAAFSPLIETASHPALSRMKDDLDQGRFNKGRDSFPWLLGKPIWTKPAEHYDGLDKKTHKVKIGWKFYSIFAVDQKAKKTGLWSVERMETHIYVYSVETDEEIIHFHFDLKNKDQLGPHVHMQLSENYLINSKRIPIAVPRFPFSTVLPTDCLDLVLSEFFPETWPKRQSEAEGVNVIRSRQRKRLTEISEALLKKWDASIKQTPVCVTQNYYFPDLQLA
ncbi:hypothetical protein OS035_01380 [Rhizobium sp. 268]|uniref:hypothetical protein n=1 Tax=Rhizobium sp. 268 TaxID=2996375 RepID=UPI002F948E04